MEHGEQLRAAGKQAALRVRLPRNYAAGFALPPAVLGSAEPGPLASIQQQVSSHSCQRLSMPVSQQTCVQDLQPCVCVLCACLHATLRIAAACRCPRGSPPLAAHEEPALTLPSSSSRSSHWLWMQLRQACQSQELSSSRRLSSSSSSSGRLCNQQLHCLLVLCDRQRPCHQRRLCQEALWAGSRCSGQPACPLWRRSLSRAGGSRTSRTGSRRLLRSLQLLTGAVRGLMRTSDAKLHVCSPVSRPVGDKSEGAF